MRLIIRSASSSGFIFCHLRRLKRLAPCTATTASMSGASILDACRAGFISCRHSRRLIFITFPAGTLMRLLPRWPAPRWAAAGGSEAWLQAICHHYGPAPFPLNAAVSPAMASMRLRISATGDAALIPRRHFIFPLGYRHRAQLSGGRVCQTSLKVKSMTRRGYKPFYFSA